MTSATADAAAPPDVYVASLASVTGWGGGVAAARGLSQACSEAGLQTRMLGVGPRRTSRRRREPGDVPAFDVVPRVPAIGWRVRNFLLAGGLARCLRTLPVPRVAFVANSPFWAVAALRTWADVPVVFRFPATLTNCLPFTWPGRRPPSLWQRLNYLAARAAERRTLRGARLILVAAEAHREELVDLVPAAAGRIEQHAFGCMPFELTDELRGRQRAELRFADDTVAIALIGVCDRNKAFDVMLDVLPGLPPRVRCLIIGDGDQREALEQQTSKRGLSGRVHFVGAQSDLAPWYAAADIVLSTSWYDAYPNVIREALWGGRCVVVPRHNPPDVYSGIAEQIEDEQIGMTYDRRNATALTGVLNELVRSPQRRAALAEQGQAWARSSFSWRSVVQRLQALR